jgi:UDP-glucuronate 4-epimerase
MKILITGSAGFIGFHLSKTLLEKKYQVYGLDNINNYYDASLKKKRISLLKKLSTNKFKFIKLDLQNKKKLDELFVKYKFDIVVNLAAQAGVRYSIENPKIYLQNNIDTFLNLLECCRKQSIKHLIYASTSSVYGLDSLMPFKEDRGSNHPTHIYAATKKCNELMAHSYSHLFNLPTTGLRFFTVYGPWGRPDMALFKFTKNILNKKNIEVYNYGKHARDFTYIDDIIQGIVSILKKIPKKNSRFKNKKLDTSKSSAPYRILNIGRGKKIKLMTYIKLLEIELNTKAKIKFLPKQKGDVQETFSNIQKIRMLGYNPKTNVKEGIKNFVKWYRKYYKK